MSGSGSFASGGGGGWKGDGALGDDEIGRVVVTGDGGVVAMLAASGRSGKVSVGGCSGVQPPI